MTEQHPLEYDETYLRILDIIDNELGASHLEQAANNHRVGALKLLAQEQMAVLMNLIDQCDIYLAKSRKGA